MGQRGVRRKMRKNRKMKVINTLERKKTHGEDCYVLVVSSKRGEERAQEENEEAGKLVQGKCQVRRRIIIMFEILKMF